MPALLLLAAVAAASAAAPGSEVDCHEGQPESWPREKRDLCCSLEGAPCPEDRAATRRAASPTFIPAARSLAETAEVASGSCKVGEAVQCPGASPGVSCAGKQCCAMANGDNFVCPSAPSDWDQCQKPKVVDCVAEDASQPYCGEVSQQAIWDWPPERKQWCCEHEGVGCPPGSAASPAAGGAAASSLGLDCRALAMDLSMASREDRERCCSQQGVGCAAEAEEADCEMDYFPGTTSTNLCPEGAHRLTEAECRAMADLFGLRAREPLAIDSATDPKGCFAFSSMLFFNTHAAGLPYADRTPYCKRCKGTNPAAQDAAGAKTLEYDCHKGLDSWEATWSTWKKMWCCDRERIACPPTTTLMAPPATSSTAALARSRTAPTPSVPELPVLLPTTQPPTAPPPPPTTTRPPATRTTTRPPATRPPTTRPPTTRPTTRPPATAAPTTLPTLPTGDPGYDCQDWKFWLWTDEQHEWCCRHKKAGCTGKAQASDFGEDPSKELGLPKAPKVAGPAPTSEPYNCSLGQGVTYSWPKEQQKWCCSRHHVACSDASPTLAAAAGKFGTPRPTLRVGVAPKAPSGTPAAAVVPTAVPTATPRVEAEKAPSGTPAAAVVPTAVPTATPRVEAEKEPQGKEYDCMETGGDGPTWWSKAKRRYCCGTAEVGCFAGRDCLADLDSMEAWSSSKKEFCCSRFTLGCPKKAPAKGEHDCTGSQELWSAEQLVWCCKQRSVKCFKDEPHFRTNVLQRFGQRGQSLPRRAEAWRPTVLEGLGLAGLAAALAALAAAAVKVYRRRGGAGHPPHSYRNLMASQAYAPAPCAQS